MRLSFLSFLSKKVNRYGHILRPVQAKKDKKKVRLGLILCRTKLVSDGMTCQKTKFLPIGGVLPKTYVLRNKTKTSLFKFMIFVKCKEDISNLSPDILSFISNKKQMNSNNYKARGLE